MTSNTCPRGLIVALCILLFSGFVAEAQDQETRRSIGLGLKTGINIGNVRITPEESSSPSSRIGLVAGGMIEFLLNANLSLGAELLYVQAGYEFSRTHWLFKSDYVAVPLFVAYRLTPETITLRPFIFCGGIPGFNVSSKTEIGNSTYDNSSNTEVFDFSAILGAGVEIAASPLVALRFDCRYAYSLTDAYVPSTSEIKGRNILITAGVAFKP